MALVSVSNISLKGVACAVPTALDRNSDYPFISKEQKEKLFKVTGIESKRIVKGNSTTSDLCFSAAEKLLKKIDWKPETVDVLLFVAQTRDYIVPSTAPILQHRLGLTTRCIAFDIPLGCSGYVYGLSVAGLFLNGGTCKRALVLAGDVLSKYTSFEDRSAYPLFGDAGSATALEFTSGVEPWHFNLQTDGSEHETIIIPDGGMRRPFNDHSLKKQEDKNGNNRSSCDVKINGEKLFEFSLREVGVNILELLEYAKKDINDVDKFVLHQANLIMTETIRKTLRIPEDKTPYSLGKFGNTGTTSIPLTMITELASKMQNGELSLLLSGFGVGLSWGSVVIKTTGVTMVPLIELDV